MNLQIDNKTARVNGKEYTLDVPPKIINGRTYMPLRFIVENLNVIPKWEADTQTVRIEY